VGPRDTTASPGELLSPAATGLGIQALARTGQGLNGPLSVAAVSIFLGALLLLAPRRGGVVVAGNRHVAVARTPSPMSGDLVEALERQLQEADARLARLRAMYGRE
jgi:hypothetical protein